MNQTIENSEEWLTVSSSSLEVGSTYPILGMITKILDESPGRVIAEISNRIQATIRLHDPNLVNSLKERAFETGIFVSTVVAVEPTPAVECSAVIFGKAVRHTA